MPVYPVERVFLREIPGKDDQLYALTSQARCFEILWVLGGKTLTPATPLLWVAHDAIPI